MGLLLTSWLEVHSNSEVRERAAALYRLSEKNNGAAFSCKAEVASGYLWSFISGQVRHCGNIAIKPGGMNGAIFTFHYVKTLWWQYCPDMPPRCVFSSVQLNKTLFTDRFFGVSLRSFDIVGTAWHTTFEIYVFKKILIDLVPCKRPMPFFVDPRNVAHLQPNKKRWFWLSQATSGQIKKKSFFKHNSFFLSVIYQLDTVFQVETAYFKRYFSCFYWNHWLPWAPLCGLSKNLIQAVSSEDSQNPFTVTVFLYFPLLLHLF